MNAQQVRIKVDEVRRSAGESAWMKMADKWEDAFDLKAFEKDSEFMLESEGREQVVLPTPQNVVNLAMRLFPDMPRISVPPSDTNVDSERKAKDLERWLKAAYKQMTMQSDKDILATLAWNALTLGRFAYEVVWVEDKLPKRLQNKRLPFIIRPLDPRDVGIKRGPLYTEYAYHIRKYYRSHVEQLWPGLRRRKAWVNSEDFDTPYESVEVIDFWYVDSTGQVCNVVVCDSEVVDGPRKTDYPDIPIYVGYGDPGSKSVLAPVRDLWLYSCRIASTMGTGMLYQYFPLVFEKTPGGSSRNSYEAKPNVIHPVDLETEFEVVQSQGSADLAERILNLIDMNIQQGTFPAVMYGDAGSMQAGYGVNLLSNAAKGRIVQFRKSLERGLATAFEIILGLIKELASDPIGVWGEDQISKDMYRIELDPDDIDNFDVKVELSPVVPDDLLQKRTLALREVEAGIISRKTYRQTVGSAEIPDDEEYRVFLEMAMTHPDVQQRALVLALSNYFKGDADKDIDVDDLIEWDTLIRGTELEKAAIDMGVLEPPPPPPAPDMPPMGPPPGLMGPEGMPPEMMGPPPGAMPPEMMGPDGMPLQPPSLTGGSDVEMGNSQMTPELLGMGLGQGMDQLAFQEAVGNGLPPEEELNAIANQ